MSSYFIWSLPLTSDSNFTFDCVSTLGGDIDPTGHDIITNTSYKQITIERYDADRAFYSHILTIKANDGYKINSISLRGYDADRNIIDFAPYFTRTDDQTFIANIDSETSPLFIQSDTTSTDYSISSVNVSAQAVTHTATITTSLNNCTMSPEITTYTLGDAITISLLAMDTLVFNDTPTLTVKTGDTILNTYDFNVNGSTASLDLSTISFDNDVNFIISGTATARQGIKPTYNVSNCTIEPNNTVYYYGDSYPTQFVINANNGYIFSETPYIYGFFSGDSYRANGIKVNDYQYIITFNAGIVTDGDIMTFNCVAIAESTPLAKKYGIINAYQPTAENMRALAKVRFVKNGTVDGIKYNDIDLAQYITTLKLCFFNATLGDAENIILGLKATSIKAPTLYEDEYIIDLGTIMLNGLYNNALDIETTNINIVLPFIDIVSLDSKTFINKTINVKYRVNVLSAKCTAYIYIVNDEQTNLILTRDGVIGYNVPFSFYQANNDDLTINNKPSGDIMFNDEPRIIVKQNKIADENIKRFNTYKINQVQKETGYFQIKDIELNNIDATLDEINEIKSLLKSGAII